LGKSKCGKFSRFVKRIVVEETASYNSAPGTIRHIIAQELKEGAIKEAIVRAMELKEKNPKVWQVEPGDYNSPKNDEATVSNIENGKKNPTLATIQKLADALKISADELLK